MSRLSPDAHADIKPTEDFLFDDPDIIITGRSDLRAIGVVVAMVAAGHTKTALYRQTLRCFGADDGQHWCGLCRQHVT